MRSGEPTEALPFVKNEIHAATPNAEKRERYRQKLTHVGVKKAWV
jgi:hypothetical protein